MAIKGSRVTIMSVCVFCHVAQKLSFCWTTGVTLLAKKGTCIATGEKHGGTVSVVDLEFCWQNYEA